MRALIAIACLAALLVGCAPTPPRTVIKYQYVVVTPKESYTEELKITTPPNPEEYSVKTPEEKEGALFDWAFDLMKTINHANLRFTAIRKDAADANEIYRGKSQVAE